MFTRYYWSYNSILAGHIEFTKKELNLSDCVAIGYAINQSDYQTVDLSFDECQFSTEGAIALLQQVGDHPFSLTLK